MKRVLCIISIVFGLFLSQIIHAEDAPKIFDQLKQLALLGEKDADGVYGYVKIDPTHRTDRHGIAIYDENKSIIAVTTVVNNIAKTLVWDMTAGTFSIQYFDRGRLMDFHYIKEKEAIEMAENLFQSFFVERKRI